MSPRPYLLVRLLAVGASAAALAAPAAVARPMDGQNDPVRPDPGTTATVEPAPGPPIVRSVDAGFDWGSAAIGAGGAGALVVLISLGGVAYTSHNRIGAAR